MWPALPNVAKKAKEDKMRDHIVKSNEGAKKAMAPQEKEVDWKMAHGKEKVDNRTNVQEKTEHDEREEPKEEFCDAGENKQQKQEKVEGEPQMLETLIMGCAKEMQDNLEGEEKGIKPEGEGYETEKETNLENEVISGDQNVK